MAALRAAGICALMLILVAPGARAAPAPPQQKIDDLVRLLEDPDLKAWLQANKRDAAVVAKPEAASGIASWELATRQRISSIVEAIPRIPSEIAAASTRTREDAVSRGYAPVMVIFAAIAAIGASAEQLFRRLRNRRKGGVAVSGSALSQLLPIAIFAAAMAVVFFAAEWPPLARIVLLVCLIAFVAYRCMSVLVNLAIDYSPVMRFRARLFLGIVVLATALSALGSPLGVEPAASEALSYCFSVILTVLAIEAVWRASIASTSFKTVLTVAVVGIWILWCLDLRGLFWIGIYVLALPPVLRGVGRAVADGISPNNTQPLDDVRSVLLIRGSRAIVVALAVAWIALVWHFNPDSLAHQNPTLNSIILGLFKSVIILLAADLLWQLTRALIDRKLATTLETAEVAPSEIARRGRLRTLLPIFRNVLAVFVIVMTALIVLSQLGVQIGPLIAGAGIFGVALGFGSQTLVKDVISGVFYMFDDAFRVGEYIQAKSYMGTVEGFSLRSVRLRHHRGPVFTVPFGELGAVQNMSRDWVIDKFKITVGYNTDINLARKIAKGIGAELQADPELSLMFITPLKMKGVESFGDYGIVLSFAMTTLPGQQSSIRRKAYAMIREAFQANGIEFATPSVQVGGDDNRGGAAAAATTVRAAEIKANLEKGDV